MAEWKVVGVQEKEDEFESENEEDHEDSQEEVEEEVDECEMLVFRRVLND